MAVEAPVPTRFARQKPKVAQNNKQNQSMKNTSLRTKLTVLTIIVAALPALAREPKAAPGAAQPTPSAIPAGVPVVMPGPQVFEALYGRNFKVLGTNLEYSATYGRRVCFKEVKSGRPVAFDVDQLHPKVLEELEIDAAAQRNLQSRQDAAWARSDAAARAEARAEKKAVEQRRREELWAPRTAVIIAPNQSGGSGEMPWESFTRAASRQLAPSRQSEDSSDLPARPTSNRRLLANPSR